MLNSNEVHVWQFDLDGSHDASILSDDERERAARLKIPLIRQRFIAARSQMRQILSQYIPEPLIFYYSSSGKPSLVGIEFNLTHTENVALLAIAHVPVGVDIERVRSVDGLDYIADSAFTANERAAIEASADKIMAFFRCWTRKEAYMKAGGDGFKIAATFSVSVDDHPRLLDIDGWSLVDVPLPAGFIGALCVQGGQKKVIMRQTENKFPT